VSRRDIIKKLNYVKGRRRIDDVKSKSVTFEIYNINYDLVVELVVVAKRELESY
jgi:hypothetical protein